MSHSDEEDSFQSADEDGFDQDQRKSSTSSTSSFESEKPDLKTLSIGGVNADHTITSQEATVGEDVGKSSPPEDKIQTCGESSDAFQETPQTKQRRPIPKQDDSVPANREDDELDDDGDDEEQALAERIRERNLKIAKKFSAEIAKNNKASAPTPVESSAPIGFKVNDIEYPNLAGSDTKSGLPPAPPPTPALSSSFNNLTDEQPSEPAMKSQYGWRLPPKTLATSGLPKTGKMVEGPKRDQTRLALDRLSANVTHSDKNLFEKVTADLKKVAIRSDDPPVADLTSSAPTLASITDLGSSLGGWGWSGASKLLSSASQVTSQVGSVLDSVVNVSQHLQQSNDNSTKSTTTTTTTKTSSDMQTNVGRPSNEIDEAPTKTVTSTTSKSPIDKTDHSQANFIEKDEGVEKGEPLPGDPLVDFTLNAMESLGKRAFNVMTERDESGSLQIKGLGRPWEHLKKLNRSYEGWKSDFLESQHQEAQAFGQKGTSETSRETNEYEHIGDSNETETLSSVDSVVGNNNSDKVAGTYEEETIPTTLKQRKRFNYNDD